MTGGGTTPPPVAGADVDGDDKQNDDELLTIGEAKRRLARTLGVSESSIKIMVEA